MGSVSLLNREEEVEIAKRIEAGEQEIAHVVLNSPIIIREVISIGEKLKADKLSIREVIADLDDEETDIDEEHYLKKMFSLIGKIKRSEQKLIELHKHLSQKNSVKPRKENSEEDRSKKEKMFPHPANQSQ